MPIPAPVSSFSRRFVALFAALAGTLALGGCFESGVTRSNAASSGGSPTPAGVGTPVNDPGTTPVPTSFPALADGAVAAEVRLGEVEGLPAQAQVFTFAHAFPPGAVRGHLVVRDGTQTLPTQVDVKRRHPDGSVRHVALTILAPPMAARASRGLEVVASSAAPPAGAVDPAVALAAGFDARVEIVEDGVTYSISAGELVASAGERWLNGPLATELRLAGFPKAGGTPHPALYVLFDVRFLVNGPVRVSVAVENTMHDTPGNRTYDVRIVLPGAGTVFTRSGVEHLHHARWRQVVWWGAPRATLAAAADWRILRDAGAIPIYDRSLAVDGAAVDATLAQWEAAPRDLMQVGIVQGRMPMAGGRPDIGPLPAWTALALLSREPRAYRPVLGSGELAGSFSTHLRDRRDARIYSIDAHPTAAINPHNPAVGRDADPADLLPLCSGCVTPYLADRPHQPSLAYVPYLVTGDAFFWDELKFWANYNFLEIAPRDYGTTVRRGYAKGLVHDDETRGQAWSMRTLGHAAWIAPDADPHRDYFGAKLANNFDWYAANAVGSNPFGWWGGVDVTSNGRPQPNFAADATIANSPWMNDFLLIAFDGLLRMGYADARPMRDWLARYPVGRFTTPAEYNPNEGDAYYLAVAGEGGRPYTSWREIYQKSTANRTTPVPAALSDLYCAYCYAAVARAALAGPVADGAPGAAAARLFIDQQFAPHRAIFTIDPTWALAP